MTSSVLPGLLYLDLLIQLTVSALSTEITIQHPAPPYLTTIDEADSEGEKVLCRRAGLLWKEKGRPFAEDVTHIDHEDNGCKDSLCNLHQQIDGHRVEGEFAIWALGHVHQHWC